MRTPEYLSYSALSLLESNPEDFYAQRLAKHRPPRESQTQPMAVGSAFDAYAKAALHAALFGHGADPRYEFSAIFESQVEKEHWDFGLRAGKHVFNAYRFCGAYDDLLSELKQSVEPPQFEFTVKKEIAGVPFQGKPDCRFILDLGSGRINCIYDWKVRGYCSKYGASPTKGYAICLDCFETTKKPSRSHGREHGLYLAKPYRGVIVNAGYFETCSTDYADQLCLYGWLLGEEPGDETVVLGIEEFVAKFMGEGEQPRLRFARHRALCKKQYQLKLLERVKAAWVRITSGHFFSEMSQEENDARCALLDDIGLQAPAETETEHWFDDVTHEQSWG